MFLTHYSLLRFCFLGLGEAGTRATGGWRFGEGLVLLA